MSSITNIVCCSAACLLFALGAGSSPAASAESGGLVYELRTYTANPGKLDALHARFRNHTMRLFAAHGMQNISYWIPTDTPDTLIYIIAHPSADAARENWQGFVNDPAWQKVFAESIADGRLIKNIDSVFMTKTDYSP